MLLVRQTRLLEPCEEEKVRQQHEGHEDEVLGGAQAVVKHGHLADGHEQVTQTRAGTKRTDQFLGDRFDVAHDCRFTNGARGLENDGSKAGAWNSKVLGRVDHRTGQKRVGQRLKQAAVEQAKVVRLIDQVVCVVHARKDGNGLDGDVELGSLQVSVILL